MGRKSHYSESYKREAVAKAQASGKSRLNRLRQMPNLATILLVSRRHQQSQQMSQGVYRHVCLSAFTPLGTIVTSMIAAFRAGLQGAAAFWSAWAISLEYRNCAALPVVPSGPGG